MKHQSLTIIEACSTDSVITYNNVLSHMHHAGLWSPACQGEARDAHVWYEHMAITWPTLAMHAGFSLFLIFPVSADCCSRAIVEAGERHFCDQKERFCNSSFAGLRHQTMRPSGQHCLFFQGKQSIDRIIVCWNGASSVANSYPTCVAVGNPHCSNSPAQGRRFTCISGLFCTA